MRRLASLARRLCRFCADQRGTIAVETVIITPLLLTGLLFSYTAYSIFREQSLREKATYTVADILSRETGIIDDTYIDNIKRMFDLMTGAGDDSQLRISVVRYHFSPHQGIDSFNLRWSELRGTGPLNELSDEDVHEAHDIFPVMEDGQEIIYVESRSTYRSIVPINFFDRTNVDTQMFVNPRFAPQVCFTGTCVPGTS